MGETAGRLGVSVCSSPGRLLAYRSHMLLIQDRWLEPSQHNAIIWFALPQALLQDVGADVLALLGGLGFVEPSVGLEPAPMRAMLLAAPADPDPGGGSAGFDADDDDFAELLSGG